MLAPTGPSRQSHSNVRCCNWVPAATTDVLAASRLANWIENGLDLPLDLDIDSTEEIARKLMEGYEGSISLEGVMGLEEGPQTSDFYV